MGSLPSMKSAYLLACEIAATEHFYVWHIMRRTIRKEESWYLDIEFNVFNHDINRSHRSVKINISNRESWVAFRDECQQWLQNHPKGGNND